MQKIYKEAIANETLDSLLLAIVAYFESIKINVASSHGSIRDCSKAEVQFMGSNNAVLTDDGHRLILTHETYVTQATEKKSHKEIEKFVWDTKDMYKSFSTIDDYVMYTYTNGEWFIGHSLKDWEQAYQFAKAVFETAVLNPDATG